MYSKYVKFCFAEQTKQPVLKHIATFLINLCESVKKHNPCNKEVPFFLGNLIYAQ